MPYSSLNGAPPLPIPVASGGTGTQTGSITGTGALTFAAGGTNNNIAINTTGTGQINAATMGLAITQPAGDTNGRGVALEKGVGYFRISNASNKTNNFIPSFTAQCFVDEGGAEPSLFFSGLQGNLGDSSYGVINFDVKSPNGGNLSSGHTAIAFTNNVFTSLISVLGNGDVRFRSTTDSTSTSTGTIRVDGGVGIAKNLNVGGTIKGLGAVENGTPASSSATGTQWQIRVDASYIYVCTATNTWKRVAISTW